MVGSWRGVNPFSTKRRVKLVLPAPRWPTTASLRCRTPRGEGGRSSGGARGGVDDGGILLPVNIRGGVGWSEGESAVVLAVSGKAESGDR